MPRPAVPSICRSIPRCTLRHRCAALAVALLFAPACSRDHEDKPPRTHSAHDGTRAASVRAKYELYRPLLDETGRAEVDGDGLAIDFGTPDQHKYTRGAWRSGWGESHEKGDTTWVDMTSRRGWLDLDVPPAPVVAISVRARSTVPNQRLTFYAGDHALGTVSVGKTWSVVRAKLAPGVLPPGPLHFEIRASASTKDTPRAELDWLQLATSATAEPPLGPRVSAVNLAGTVHRALPAPTARAYRFYLQAPAHAHLVVALGAAKKAHFSISAEVDGKPPIELLATDVAGRWTENDVSLAPIAGRAARLTLRTTDQTGRAAWGEPEIMLERPTAPRAPTVAGGAPPRNLIIILMDTARADAFGPFAFPDRVAQTPTYDALAAKSTVFLHAYANENWTKPSVASVLTGMYPSTHGTKTDSDVLPKDVELVSQHLQQRGFATAGFVANGYISNKFGFEKGWDTFHNYIRESEPSEAEHVYGDGLAWLQAHHEAHPDQPFFLYLQTIDPHVPYRVGKPYWSRYFEGTYDGPLGDDITSEDQVKLSKKKIHATARDLQWLKALYFGEITYSDDYMGRFFAGLDKLGLRDSTLIVVTNDHGEELGDRGHFGHGHQLHQELVRSPLLFSYAPVFAAGNKVDDIVELVDVVPTALDVLGQPPMNDADGQSILPLVRRQPVSRPRYAITEFLYGFRSVRVGRYELIAGAGYNDPGEVYDLQADPHEQHELGKTEPIARRLCQIMLGEGLAVPNQAERQRGMGGQRRFRAGTAKIDPAMRRQLQALGYLGAGAAGHVDKPKQKEKK